MAQKAYGTKLQSKVGAGAWTDVARVKRIKPAEVTAADIDSTVLDSADEFEETLAGLGSGGELEATVEYDKTKMGTLYGLFRTTASYRVLYTDGSGWTYSGYLQSIGDDEIINGEIVTTTIKIKVTGKPVHEATVTP